MPNNPTQNKSEVSAAQEFIDIKDIRDDMIILKSGGVRKVLLLSTINFELKSQDERQAIINQYQAFLNSLEFPIQILISSRQANIEEYIDSIKEKATAETNPLIKIQAEEYINFIKNLVDIGNITTKNFLLTVPYYPKVGETAGGFGKKISQLIAKIANKPAQKEEINEEQLAEWQRQVYQRTEYIIAGLTRLGIKAVPLDTESLVELIYGYYNP